MAEAATQLTDEQPETGRRPKKDDPARVVPQVTPERMQLAEFTTAQFTAIIHAGLEPDDLLPVAYWAHVAEMLKQNMTIVVTTEDMKWRAEMVVVDAGKNWAKVVFLTTEEGKRLITKLGGLQPQKIVMLPGHTVNYAGIYDKWRVVRDIDGQVLTRNHSTEGDAYSWLAEYAKSIRK